MALTDSSPANKNGILARLGDRLASTRRALGRGLDALLAPGRSADPAALEEIETTLLQADVGVDATQRILRQAEAAARTGSDLRTSLRQALLDIIRPCERPFSVPVQEKPFVVLVVGVNGAGKTTTLGKLTRRLQDEGKKVMLAAADTFRAAAVEQLKVWGSRNHVPVIAQETGADAAAVAHDAMQAAAARAMDVLLIDTAGRLHTQSGLMDELKKVKRIVQRIDPGAPHEVLLVLDASIGQNALAQLEHFHAAVNVTGLILTKLDGTARGGVAFALAMKFGIPFRYIGVGEGIDDLRVFNAEEFVDALLPEGL